MPQPPLPFVCRFAPSPNGRLHLGHAFSALVNAEAAARTGGTLLLRMEDIDTTRCRPEFERGILDDLAWLGIVPAAPPRRQSEHFADYAEALARLEGMGLVYPAFESRSDIARAVIEAEAKQGHPAPQDPDGAPLYPFQRSGLSDGERAQRRAAGEPYVLRLDMAAALKAVGSGPLFWPEARDLPEGPAVPAPADPAQWGDVVLARRDVPTSYHLSVVVDDALQGITRVIRGMDLFHATSVHVLLQRLLGLETPVYHHHRLILDASGHKLSKSNSATSLLALRTCGATPSDIRARLGLDAPQPTPRM
ncbi:glutamyl-Q tRNA(Asp) synthetase [Xanthobacter flavus]|uniref:Glutamyl-Q tRNA(Asp) synthetase n=1 Tax=Xanthobacter flavus TaxID=281 RepID=A0A9W6FIJ9_XANFL|nr:tRNA glutamyl-Q(34) synthetase GluQRS [Xanthobacter flavus]MDR6332559.1 glutamyl-Q tRNA(Asp) synthetase [Xanthobacter flavus]GLI21689.1 tRNA glutamyl-Q(34) synthetase GluQRS [Xanthobacter flavus]